MNLTGIEHRTTSAWHPMGNGGSENMNKTIIGCIRKHTNDPTNWIEWIPYVLMAYRTRINPITNKTPQSLMFGRESNGFADFTNEPTEDEAAIVFRANEIKKLFEVSVPDAISSIKEKQVKQIKNQNKTLKVNAEEFSQLEVGTKCMIRTSKIQPKLNPRCHGPYIIHSVTSVGNYKLINKDNMLIKGTFTRDKLIVVPADIHENVLSGDDGHVEIEKIIKHRKKGDQLQYLVKWVGFGPTHNEWLNTDAFDTTEILEDYHSKVAKPSEIKSSAFGLFTLFQIFLIINLCLTGTFGNKIDGKFKYCSIGSNAQTLALDDTCKHFDLHNNHISKEITMLEKRLFNVEGVAFQCKKYEVRLTMWMSMFFWKQWRRVKKTVFVSNLECREMMMFHRCESQTLTCKNDRCETTLEPVQDFPLLGETTTRSYHCFVLKRTIQGNPGKQLIVGESRCWPEDLHCYSYPNTIIWDKNTIHTCEYQRIKTATMQISDTIVTAPEDSKLFEISNRNVSNSCGLKLWSTTEGVYLSPAINVSSIPVTKLSSVSKNHIILAEVDFKIFQVMSIMFKLHNKNTKRICNIVKSIILSYQSQFDQFFIINDDRDKEVILYNNN